ncbi:formyltetrahydrofolate deformylase [Altererythrobacter atlanticus]|uniref:Formyltetrahydrofolate deformylase n=1 Tax=Croceibacterium atlanticum TaxID=1267766 RepID=A0A0F7KU88_9SPHN|nr:formyltetrahydrofolate deformylase [Croceibacterium atlanticum]AKH43888.1 Formyltetrahydrofolate deformylase [Croceibacterium atlanticum]MBB5733662.1 formyltetrahydrofolate deformylase [Croceibacterium atlanticum]
MPSCTLSLSCPIKPGVSARVSSFTAERGCTILEAQQFSDRVTGRFFMRVVFDPAENQADVLRTEFAALARQFDMQWELRDPEWMPKVVLMVSKFDHCLGDLLYRMRIGEIAMDVVAIISNHPQHVLTTSLIGDIPYHHYPITRETKPQQEAQVRQVVEETEADLVVLARYMQVLSDEMAAFLNGRCINIHHSFLPGFKGAKPYHQAYKRGVKMIGATSHYVTTDLDEGPIIAQDVEPCGHVETPEDLVAKGRDVERRVLAKAVKAHLQDRVFLNGHRTVVFDG